MQNSSGEHHIVTGTEDHAWLLILSTPMLLRCAAGYLSAPVSCAHSSFPQVLCIDSQTPGQHRRLAEYGKKSADGNVVNVKYAFFSFHIIETEITERFCVSGASKKKKVPPVKDSWTARFPTGVERRLLEGDDAVALAAHIAAAAPAAASSSAAASDDELLRRNDSHVGAAPKCAKAHPMSPCGWVQLLR